MPAAHQPMPFSQATAGMPDTRATKASQHVRQLDVNLFSDARKIRLTGRNLTSEKILTCYRLDPAPKRRVAIRPAAPQAKRHWRISGELDMAEVGSLVERANAALRAMPVWVLVDLSGLTFIDVHGARALITLSRTLALSLHLK